MIKIIGYILMTFPVWAAFVLCWKNEGLKIALFVFGSCFLLLCVILVGMYLVENG